MSWQRRPDRDRGALETRFRALARLIERKGFRPDGLVVIEVEGAYVIRGMRPRASSETPTISSETIAAADLAAEIDALRA